MLRIGALATIAGTLIYVAMSILHGNPPIGDASKILDHVVDRPWVPLPTRASLGGVGPEGHNA